MSVVGKEEEMCLLNVRKFKHIFQVLNVIFGSLNCQWRNSQGRLRVDSKETTVKFVFLQMKAVNKLVDCNLRRLHCI